MLHDQQEVLCSLVTVHSEPDGQILFYRTEEVGWASFLKLII